MESRNNIIRKKIREIAKDYQSKGYKVFVEPSRDNIPDFLGDFKPDIIARSANDNIIAEVKISSKLHKNDFNYLETIARIVEQQNDWRFDLIFTNPKEIDENEGKLFINDTENSKRIELAKKTLDDDISLAFIMLWIVLESVLRQKGNIEISNKTVNVLIKNLYSVDEISYLEYKKLDDLFKLRNNIVHGFYSAIDRSDFDALLQIIQKITGESKYSFIYEWITNQDLENYLEVYSLYSAVQNEESTDLFTVENDNTDNLIIKSYTDTSLKINNDLEKQALLDFLSEEYMNGMDEESYYSFNYQMSKDD